MEINTFARKYGIDDFKKYERVLAQEDISGMFVNTSFIEEGSMLTAIYRYEGYLKASLCRFRSQIQILNLVEKVLQKLSHAADYYISPERIEISSDTVFYRPSDEDVRMAFVISESRSLKTELIEFCRDMRDRFDNGDVSGINRLIVFLEEQPFTIKEAAAEIRKIKTEVII